MLKRLFALILLLVLLLTITGCAKLISTETEKVDVLITETNYQHAWSQPVIVNKVITLIHHPAQYEVTVKYDGIEYTLDDETYYKAYKDRVGETITGTLEIQTYDDSTIKKKIVALEG